MLVSQSNRLALLFYVYLRSGKKIDLKIQCIISGNHSLHFEIQDKAKAMMQDEVEGGKEAVKN